MVVGGAQNRMETAVRGGRGCRVKKVCGLFDRLRSGLTIEKRLGTAYLELALSAAAVGLLVFQEVGGRFAKLVGHELERLHRWTDLAELDRAHVGPREVRRPKLGLAQTRFGPGLADAVSDLLQRVRYGRGPADTGADLRHRAANIGGPSARVNRESTACATGLVT